MPTQIKAKTQASVGVDVGMSDFKIGLASFKQLQTGRMKRSVSNEAKFEARTRMKRNGETTAAGADAPELALPDENDPLLGCNPFTKQAPPIHVPNLPHCKPNPPAESEPIPTIYQGSLEFGAPGCWTNEGIAEESKRTYRKKEILMRGSFIVFLKIISKCSTKLQ